MNRRQLLTYGLLALLMPALPAREAMAQGGPLVLERNERVISLEPRT
ncbi:MAG TPA: hypothetical protein VG498_09640 [Terriglobales bacterium]|nr:hypothetical protein [Terriglobales bacterium]